MLLAEFGTGQVFWSMLWFFLFFIWIWLLISLFGDIFRSKDLSGWGKALWTIFIIILPFLGVLVYLIVRGNSMQERALQDAANRESAVPRLRAVGRGHDAAAASADELAKLADLRDKGVISDDEFQAAKAKALA